MEEVEIIGCFPNENQNDISKITIWSEKENTNIMQ